MTRPAVLLVSDTLVVGGLERVVVELARGLDARGWRVGVLAGPGPLWDELPEGVARHRLPGRASVRSVRAVRRLVRARGYELVSVHQRGVALAARWATAGLHVPVVEHVHNVFGPTLVARAVAFRGGPLIACGTAVAEMLVDGFGRPAGRVHLVRNGVRDPRPTGDVARRSGLRVVGVGRMTEQKDPVRFVRVVAELVGLLGADRVSAEWVGDGPLMGEVRAAVAAAGLEGVLDLPGELPAAADRIAAADLLVLTSRWEGLPLVALEALAIGRGVLLPDVGSCRDAVGSGGGALYPVDLDERALAARIADLVAAGRIEEWQREARGIWEAEFAFDRVVDGVERVFAGEGVAVPAVRAVAA